MSLPKRHKMLNSKDGFNELFDRELSRHQTQEETYNELRKESLVVFGKCRYKTFESFRVSRSKWINNKQSLN